LELAKKLRGWAFVAYYKTIRGLLEGIVRDEMNKRKNVSDLICVFFTEQ
jgi:hypothetical protein